MTHNNYAAARGFIENAQNASSDGPAEEQIHLAYAQVHASLTVADRLAQLVELFAAWRADIESVPMPAPLTADEVARQLRRASSAQRANLTCDREHS